MVITVEDIITFFKFVQSLNAFSPISVTPSGIYKDSIFVPAKALAGITVIDCGILILDNLVDENTDEFNDVILSVIFIERKF